MTGIDYPKRGSIEGVEVQGGVILGFLQGMGVFKQTALKILNEHGISDPKASRWYPLEPLQLVFKKMEDEGRSSTLKLIGAAVINTAQWPEIKSLGKSLCSLDISYHMNHRRNGKECFDPRTGKVIESKLGHCILVPPNRNGGNRAILINASFYPCEFVLGMVQALAHKFKPKECSHYAKVRHDPVECRKKGKETCRYIIEW